MGKAYRTIDDVWRSPWASIAPADAEKATDRVLRSTKLEDSIYAELREDDAAMDDVEKAAQEKAWNTILPRYLTVIVFAIRHRG